MKAPLRRKRAAPQRAGRGGVCRIDQYRSLLRVRVTKAAQDNTIARIVRLVEEAESAIRAPTASGFIDAVSARTICRRGWAWCIGRRRAPACFGRRVGRMGPYRALALLLNRCPVHW